MKTGREPAPELGRMNLASGRQLVWREYGAPDGNPVVHHHGGLFSGAEAQLADTSARTMRIRFIVPNRAGIGASDPQPGRTIRDWGDAMREFLDAQAIDTCGMSRCSPRNRDDERDTGYPGGMEACSRG